MLQREVAKRVKDIILQVAREGNAEVVELEIIPDHVQLLVEIDPQYGIHKLIKQMKGRSSRILRSEFP